MKLEQDLPLHLYGSVDIRIANSLVFDHRLSRVSKFQLFGEISGIKF